MIHIINFRRGLCLLLACLVLCFSVLRPVVVSATGVETAALAGFVGIAPEVAIPIILVLLGVAYVGAHWDQICNVVEDALDSFQVEINDDVYISGYEYNGNTYIDHAIVEAVANSVLEYNEAKFGEAWELGKDFRYMYTIKYTNNYRQAYIWTDSNVNVTNDGNYTYFDCTGDYVSYYAYTGSNPYNTTYDSRTEPAVTHAFSMSNNLYDTYSVTDMVGVLDPTITYGDTIAVTNPITDDDEIAIPIAPSASVPATKTEEEVIVSPTTPDVVPGTGTADLSGILSWLKAIWDAIKALAGSITNPIVNAISAVKTGVVSIADFLTGTAYVASPLEAIHFAGLFDLFPFNIPKGIYDTISFWAASSAPPVITVPLPNYGGGGVDIYEFEINLSEIPGIDALAALIRAGELILFAVGLVILTEKVTKW